jgi:hypothetical protein
MRFVWSSIYVPDKWATIVVWPILVNFTKFKIAQERNTLMYSMFVEQGYEPPSKKSCPSMENRPLDCTKSENNVTDLRMLQVMRYNWENLIIKANLFF